MLLTNVKTITLYVKAFDITCLTFTTEVHNFTFDLSSNLAQNSSFSFQCFLIHLFMHFIVHLSCTARRAHFRKLDLEPRNTFTSSKNHSKVVSTAAKSPKYL